MTDDELKRLERAIDKAAERVVREVASEFKSHSEQVANSLMRFNERLRAANDSGSEAIVRSEESVHLLRTIGEAMQRHVDERVRRMSETMERRLGEIASASKETTQIVRSRAEQSAINLEIEAAKAEEALEQARRDKRAAYWLRVYTISIPLIATLISIFAGFFAGAQSQKASQGQHVEPTRDVPAPAK